MDQDAEPAPVETLLAGMLTRVRGPDRRRLAAAPPSRQAQADWFAARLGSAARAYLDDAHRAWCEAGELSPHRPDALMACWPAHRLPQTAALLQETDLCSVPGLMAPAAALAIQQRTGSELALNLVYDAHRDRLACFSTRGCRGGVMSDLMFFFAFSPRYLVLPIYHTHPSALNELGRHRPSCADYLIMARLRDLLGIAVAECVHFPDGTCTEYGFAADARAFFRPQGGRVQWCDGLLADYGGVQWVRA